MQETVLEQIIDLENAFKNGGIYFMEYLSKKRLLRIKIDYEVELRLDQAMSLLVRNKISKEQYNTYKSNLENSKQYYKKRLANT